MEPLTISTPEAEGISSQAILDFVDAVESRIDALHSMMLLRHGKVIAQGWWYPYRADHRHRLFSLSKSFTSTAIGFAVTEGHLSIDDRVVDFFPEDLPPKVSDHLARMRIRHLLTMTTGHEEDSLPAMGQDPEGNWVRAFLRQPVPRQPGTHFLYDTGATYMLSAIIQKIMGIPLLAYLRPRLLDPLGIEDATWETCPRGINTGGYGLSVRTEAIARFGQFYLQGGEWAGEQLLPASWIREATARQVSNAPYESPDWEQGYGYQFWRCRHNAYRGDGAFGQFCLVMPDQDAVLAITAGTGDMQGVLDLVWDHLLPAMAPHSLPQNPEGASRLAARLANLQLTPVAGAASTSVAQRILGGRYRMQPAVPPSQTEEPGSPVPAQSVHAVSLERQGNAFVLTVEDEWGPQQVVCGYGEWREGEMRMGGAQPSPMAASGAWTAGDTFTARLCFVETPFCPTITCRFAGDLLHYQMRMNVGFGPLELPPLTGKRGAE